MLLLLLLPMFSFSQEKINASSWGEFASTKPIKLYSYTHNNTKESKFLDTFLKFTKNDALQKYRMEFEFYCKTIVPFTDRITMFLKYGDNTVDNFNPDDFINYKGVLSDRTDAYRNKFSRDLQKDVLQKIGTLGITKIRIGYIDFDTKKEQYYDWIFSESQTNETKDLITLLEKFDIKEHDRIMKENEKKAKSNLSEGF